jgi:hypothetical protein
MSIYTLRREQLVPRPLEEVFTFFSDARNLQKITPSWLNFQILTAGPIEIRPGTLLDYRLKWHGISIQWRYEIEAWDPPHRFTDVRCGATRTPSRRRPAARVWLTKSTIGCRWEFSARCRTRWECVATWNGSSTSANRRSPRSDADSPPPNRLGVGLPQVRRRLELRYGDAASMEAGPHQGVYRVELRFPCESPMASSSRA